MSLSTTRIEKEKLKRQNKEENNTEEEINSIDEEKVFEQYDIKDETDDIEKKFYYFSCTSRISEEG